jgi:dihydrofolate synthase/folylpolyglutamate synthase
MIDAHAAGARPAHRPYTSPHLETVRRADQPRRRADLEERLVATYREVEPLAELIDARYAEPLTVLRHDPAMAYAAFADAPVDFAVVEVGLGGEDDATNVIEAGVCVITPIGLDTPSGSATRSRTSPGPRPASSTRAPTGDHRGCRPRRPCGRCLERLREMGATLAREGSEFGVGQRRHASAARCSPCKGSAASTTRSSCRCSARTRHRTRRCARRGRGVPRRRLRAKQLDTALVREGFANVDSPAGSERVRSAPTILLDGAHNPHGMAATVARWRRSSVPAPGRGGRGARRQGRVRPARPARAGRGPDRGHAEQLAALDAG